MTTTHEGLYIMLSDPTVRLDDLRPTDLLTTTEVAAITRAPAATVRYWRHLGTGPKSFRVGRRVLYRRSELEQWLSDQERAGDRDRR